MEKKRVNIHQFLREVYYHLLYAGYEDMSIDLSNYQKTGVSKVIIKYDKQAYQKKTNTSSELTNTQEKIETTKQPLYQHPKADELNKLEKQKQIAKQNNDEIAYSYAQSRIESIIRKNRVEVSPEKWDSMSIDEQISFIKIKMNEAKVLNDHVEFDYWNANLKALESKKLSQSKIQEYHQPLYNSAPVVETEIKNEQDQVEKENETKSKDYRYYYDEMIKAVKQYNPSQKYTEQEKKQMIGEIFYNEGYLIDRISTEQEFKDIMESVVNDLNDNEMETRLSNIVFTEMQEKYKKLNSKVEIKSEESKQQETVSSNNELDLSVLINGLRNELTKIQNAYQSMLSDGYIDDIELATLTSMIDKVIDNGYSLKSIATEQNDIRTISVIIDTLEQEQKKMKRMQNGIEEIGRAM